jgi:hypothetical protein
MTYETPNEATLIRYARTQELKRKTKKELFEDYKRVSLELGRLITEHTRLQNVADALEAEIQPYLEHMDALEGAEQDAYIDSMPEHVRQSIDLLEATFDALKHIEALSEDLSQIQKLTDQLYDASVQQETEEKVHRSIPH